MNVQGVIFDFNGTLFWDTEYHNKAWDIYLAKHNQQLTDQEKDVYIHGKPNRNIFEFLEKRELSEAELESRIEEKEGIYQEICNNLNLSLAPGAEEFLNFLKERKVPFTIATSSGWGNVKFYFEYLNLEKWFSIDKVVYDDGSYKGKPEPDIFLIAAHKLDLPIKLCAIFEDSLTGLKAANNAKAGVVFFVRSNNSIVPPEINVINISDFNQVDRKMFL
jgi:HAD superfamily hydrolase (TIGR01509 family)